MSRCRTAVEGPHTRPVRPGTQHKFRMIGNNAAQNDAGSCPDIIFLLPRQAAGKAIVLLGRRWSANCIQKRRRPREHSHPLPELLVASRHRLKRLSGAFFGLIAARATGGFRPFHLTGSQLNGWCSKANPSCRGFSKPILMRRSYAATARKSICRVNPSCLRCIVDSRGESGKKGRPTPRSMA